MTTTPTTTRRRPAAVSLAMATLLALALLPAGAAAHPGEDHETATGLGVLVTSPEDVHGFFPAVQWGDSGRVDFQAAELVYAGTGCTPASYAAVATEIRGNIALVDSRVSETNPADQCPAFSFVQKAQSAEKAGAIGFVQIPGEGEDPRDDATAVTAEIPALEVERTPEILAVRDAVIAGTEPVEATLTRPENFEAMSDIPCVDGMAGPFECDGIDLLGFVPQEDFNGAGVSDLWGWTDPESGDEYVIIGKTNGVAFFRVTDPTAPVYLGELPNPAELHRVWHDIKVYADHAFIVSESEPHGMSVFDLTRLRGLDEPQTWDRDAAYQLHSAAHNVEVNVDTGFAYIVGGNAGLVVPDHCLSGLHMVDINQPTSPTFAGCYLEEGGPGTLFRTGAGLLGDDTIEAASPAAYVHDAQCVIYDGPDERYTGREICFNSAERMVVIADVTDKLAPVTLGVTDYPMVGYTHQGWLTEDQAYLLVNDEADETTFDINTRTVVLDVTDLEDPKLHFEHFHDTRAVTHNNYVHEGLVYQSNYSSGLRVLDTAFVGDPDDPRLEPVGFFDTFPQHGDPTFDGTWSNYPFFESGTIAVSGRAEGLFLLTLHDTDGEVDDPEAGVEVACTDCPVEIRAGESGTANLAVTNTGDGDDTYTITLEDVPDGWTATADPEAVEVPAGETRDVAVTIEVPRNERAGTSTLAVTATSTADPEVSESAAVDVAVRKGPPSDAGPPDRAGPPGGGEAAGPASAPADGAAMAPASATATGGLPVGLAIAVVLMAALAALRASTLRRRLTT